MSLFLAAGVVTAGTHTVILSLYVEPIYMLVISLLWASRPQGRPI